MKIKEYWLREAVFGMEDGMVSTLGAITGIAFGAQEQSIIIMSGLVVIAVESISMGVGSYLSRKTITDWHERQIEEEKTQIGQDLFAEKKELKELLIRDGWPPKIAEQMALTASKNKQLLYKEMFYRELGLPFGKKNTFSHGGQIMFLAYITGGLIPLCVYFFLNWQTAWWIASIVTLIALFLLGFIVAGFAKTNRLRSGGRVFILGGLALFIGMLAGWLSQRYLGV